MKLTKKQFKTLKNAMVVSPIPDDGLYCAFHKCPMVECDRYRIFTKFCYTPDSIYAQELQTKEG